MLNSIKFANAVAIISVVCQGIYLIVAAAAPDSIYFYVNSMTPGYDFSAAASRNIDYGLSLIGIVLMAITVWVFVYATIRLYNRLNRASVKTIL